MDQLKTDINGKFPFVLDDIRFLDEAYRNAFIALAKGVSFNENVILSGLDITTNGNNSYTYSEGFVIIEGRILLVNETTLSVEEEEIVVVRMGESWNSQGLKMFANNTLHQTYKVVKGFISTVPVDYVGAFVDIVNARRVADLRDYDGLINKGRLSSSDNLNDIRKNGLFTIVGKSLPVNFPDAEILNLENENISDFSSFFLKVLNLGDGKVYQEVGFKKGILAKRHIGISTKPWVSYWAKTMDVLGGSRKCSAISPFTLQKHGEWLTIPSNGIFNTSSVFLRKLTNGQIEIRGSLYHIEGNSGSAVLTLPEDYRTNKELKYTVPVRATDDSKYTSGVISININGTLTLEANGNALHLNIIYSIN